MNTVYGGELARQARIALSPTAIAERRVSAEEQANEGVSLDAQKRAMRAYRAMRGLDLVDVGGRRMCAGKVRGR